MKIVTKHHIHTPPRDIIQLVVSFHYCLHIEIFLNMCWTPLCANKNK